MPRTARMIVSEEKAVYHVISRTALEGLPFRDLEKEAFVRILKKVSRIYFTEVFGYAVLGNHFHLLVSMRPMHHVTDEEIKKRYILAYGEDAPFPEGRIEHFRTKWTSLSEYIREIKQSFSREFNRSRNRRGTLWGERFKSVIVESGDTLVNCLAYIDLNAVRAGIVKRPENYRWCSLGYHAQTGNADGFLSTDFGLTGFGHDDEKGRFRRYRRYVYEAGALKKKDGKSGQVIDSAILEKERKKNHEFTSADRLRYRTRYFSDSGIIGSKVFVVRNFQRFRHLFDGCLEKRPRPVTGLCRVYSLKRLQD